MQEIRTKHSLFYAALVTGWPAAILQETFGRRPRDSLDFAEQVQTKKLENEPEI